MSKLKTAVVGLGDIAQVHLAALEKTPNAQLTAVCDCNPDKSALVPGAAFYTDFHQLLERERPDCVHICLPHHLHYPFSKVAAQAGANVFCEKPIALNAGEAAQFAALEQEHPGVKLAVCFQNRRNESFEKLMELLANGAPGKVTGICANVPWARLKSYYEASPWRGTMESAGGGVMINQSIHTLDLIQLIGGKISSIRGSVSQLLDYGIEVEDTANAQILFENGAIGYFSATVANFRNDGVSIAVSTEREEYRIADNTLYRQRTDGSWESLAEDARMPGEKFYYGASHAKLIRQFYDCLEQDTQDYIHASEGVTSIRMIDAIRESSATGSPVRFE